MDISEKRKPQDGSFGAKLSGRDLDFRVATSGSKAGEKLVMRILDNSGAVTKMEDLGMRAKLIDSKRRSGDAAAWDVLYAPRPGPASRRPCMRPSAKSTAIRKHHHGRRPDRVRTDNVTQIGGQHQVRPDVRHQPARRSCGKTLTSSRSRSATTRCALIACCAANTGHMVFSTVHSNDAVTALFRLDLPSGVEPFMIASALS